MATGRRLEVARPAFTPLPFGLWATTQAVDDPDVHWQSGTQMVGDDCAPSHVTVDPCPTPPAAKTPTNDIVTRCSEPFTVYSWIDCGPVGQWGPADGQRFTDLTVEALLRGEARRVEREFWSGDAGTNPHLAEDTPASDGSCELQTAATVVATGVSVTQAIAAIEGAIASCYGGLGVIHMPFGVASLETNTTLEKKGGKLLTFMGTPVVAGSGYPGTSPAGAAPAAGTSWIYGTGAVIIRRSAVKVTDPKESLDRAVNSMVMVAERTYVVGWECCHFAALATTGISPPVVGA